MGSKPAPPLERSAGEGATPLFAFSAGQFALYAAHLEPYWPLQLICNSNSGGCCCNGFHHRQCSIESAGKIKIKAGALTIKKGHPNVNPYRFRSF